LHISRCIALDVCRKHQGAYRKKKQQIFFIGENLDKGNMQLTKTACLPLVGMIEVNLFVQGVLQQFTQWTVYINEQFFSLCVIPRRIISFLFDTVGLTFNHNTNCLTKG